MTGQELLIYLQMMTPEERAAPILVHVDTEDDEVMGEPSRIWHEFDCNDDGIIRLQAEAAQ